jgi:hypothetical protein
MAFEGAALHRVSVELQPQRWKLAHADSAVAADAHRHGELLTIEQQLEGPCLAVILVLDGLLQRTLEGHFKHRVAIEQGATGVRSATPYEEQDL